MPIAHLLRDLRLLSPYYDYISATLFSSTSFTFISSCTTSLRYQQHTFATILPSNISSGAARSRPITGLTWSKFVHHSQLSVPGLNILRFPPDDHTAINTNHFAKSLEYRLFSPSLTTSHPLTVSHSLFSSVLHLARPISGSIRSEDSVSNGVGITTHR